MAIALTPELQEVTGPLAANPAAADVPAPAAILAGEQGTLNPAAGVPAQQPISPIYTPLSGRPQGVVGPAPAEIERTPPAPGSFADKLTTALATAHAVMSGLSVAGAVGKAPAGGGVLYGIGKAGQAIAAQDAAAQERKDKLAQEDKQNERLDAAQQLEKKKFELYTAEANARMANEQRVLHQTTQQAVERSIDAGSALVKRMKTAPVPGVATHENLTTGKLRELQLSGSIAADETAYPTGKQFTGGTEQDGEPAWETTWTTVKLPEHYHLTDDDIKEIQDLPQFQGENGQADKMKIPTDMSGAQFNSLWQDAQDRTTAIAARDKAVADAKIASEDEAAKMDWRDLGPQWMNAMANNGNNQFKAAGALMANKQFRDTHPHFMDEVMNNYGGPKAWMDAQDAQQKNAIDEIKAKAEAESKMGFLGDPSKTGNPSAFLASLSPQERAVVQEMGTGKMPLTRMDYLASRNPNLLAAVAVAYPDFDGSKVQSYVNTYKDFTSGATSKALNSGGTAMMHLKRLYDNTNLESRIPGTTASKERDADISQLAAEIERFNTGGTSAPGEKQMQDRAESLGRAWYAPVAINRKAGLKEQARLMLDKMNNYQTQWQNAAPSDAYQAPMPGISVEAKVAAQYILNDGKYVVTTHDGRSYVAPNENAAIQLQRAADQMQVSK